MRGILFCLNVAILLGACGILRCGAAPSVTVTRRTLIPGADSQYADIEYVESLHTVFAIQSSSPLRISAFDMKTKGTPRFVEFWDAAGKNVCSYYMDAVSGNMRTIAFDEASGLLYVLAWCGGGATESVARVDPTDMTIVDITPIHSFLGFSALYGCALRVMNGQVIVSLKDSVLFVPTANWPASLNDRVLVAVNGTFAASAIAFDTVHSPATMFIDLGYEGLAAVDLQHLRLMSTVGRAPFAGYFYENNDMYYSAAHDKVYLLADEAHVLGSLSITRSASAVTALTWDTQVVGLPLNGTIHPGRGRVAPAPDASAMRVLTQVTCDAVSGTPCFGVMTVSLDTSKGGVVNEMTSIRSLPLDLTQVDTVSWFFALTFSQTTAWLSAGLGCPSIVAVDLSEMTPNLDYPFSGKLSLIFQPIWVGSLSTEVGLVAYYQAAHDVLVASIDLTSGRIIDSIALKGSDGYVSAAMEGGVMFALHQQACVYFANGVVATVAYTSQGSLKLLPQVNINNGAWSMDIALALDHPTEPRLLTTGSKNSNATCVLRLGSSKAVCMSIAKYDLEAPLMQLSATTYNSTAVLLFSAATEYTMLVDPQSDEVSLISEVDLDMNQPPLTAAVNPQNGQVITLGLFTLTWINPTIPGTGKMIGQQMMGPLGGHGLMFDPKGTQYVGYKNDGSISVFQVGYSGMAQTIASTTSWPWVFAASGFVQLSQTELAFVDSALLVPPALVFVTVEWQA